MRTRGSAFRSWIAGTVLASCTAATMSCGGPAGESSALDPPGARRDTYDQLRQDLEAPRHPSDGGGRAWLETGPDAAHPVASSTARWTVVYEAGPDGIEPGGAVRLIVSPFWNWSPPQTNYPDTPGYTTVDTEADGVELNVSVPSFVNAVIEGRKLEPGERVRFHYGAGQAGASADSYSEEHSWFYVGVDGDGDGVHALIEESPSVPVRPGPAAQMVVVLPSTARPGDAVTARVVVLDDAGNAGVPFAGAVAIEAIPQTSGLPGSVVFDAKDLGVRTFELRAGEPGVLRIVAEGSGDGRKLQALSNPLLVEERGTRILWGDLHGHTALSDGTGTVADYLRYARDDAGLDVVAVTDHDHWGFVFLDARSELWSQVIRDVETFNEPGRFVTLPGYEWTNWIHGHRHVLYFGEPGEVLSSMDPDYDTPPELWDALRGQDVLTFAHHSAGGPVPTNWEFPPDPELEPVTEISSVHGSSEAADSPHPIYDALPGNWVRDALDRGYRLGFVGSGDSHDGHPGLVHLEAGYGGLAAILAADLTRGAVRDALTARRTYATNGPRIILRSALGGRPIGSELDAAQLTGETTLYVRAVASAPLSVVDVIRSGSVVESADAGGSFDFESVFQLEGLSSGEYVYVRVVQTDGGAAWCTPFFID